MGETMPDSNIRSDDSPGDSRPEPVISDAVATTEAYETDEGVVFYDVDNPLAWIQSRTTLSLDEMN